MVTMGLIATQVSASCRDDRVGLRGEFGEVYFTVEVADDAKERGQGLMYREVLPRSSGMLFVYENESHVSFWMHNTLIPLDMIFADATGHVVRVHENAVPFDKTPIPSGEPAQYILEINAGLAAEIGISEGAVLRHPVITSPDALWPCETAE